MWLVRMNMFLLILFITSCWAEDTSEEEMEPIKLVGGNEAKVPIPYQVSLRKEYNRHICGGCIVNKNWILTAAHCLQHNSIKSVYVGSNHLDQGGIFYSILHHIIHPNYNNWTLENDIGLIKTSNILFTNRVMPIQLPTNELKVNSNLTITGWGTRSYLGGTPRRLQMISVNSMALDECRRILKSKYSITDGNLCTFAKRGIGVCNGDSGGPLVSNGIVYGLVSWGRPCAVGFPDVNTLVLWHVSWINGVMLDT